MAMSSFRSAMRDRWIAKTAPVNPPPTMATSTAVTFYPIVPGSQVASPGNATRIAISSTSATTNGRTPE